MMIERNERNKSEQCVTCSTPFLRNERNTPLGGVTVVRWGGWLADLVPMPPFMNGGGTGGCSLAFALCGSGVAT